MTTSGVVVVAKNSKAAGIFSKILRDGFRGEAVFGVDGKSRENWIDDARVRTVGTNDWERREDGKNEDVKIVRRRYRVVFEK